ncbi:MAG: Lrp/AsnC family transcriptional regulator [Desulfobacterales bacterium]|nr:Lrp/AsnC family transcriptional regulator [Desulfobacterales bacterium]
MITEIEKKIIACVQGDIPVTSRPYKEIADKLNISEEFVLDTLEKLSEKGIIRRFGATLRHQKSGYDANAMIAWIVDDNTVDDVGKKMAKNKHISHCYRRRTTSAWPYNLYTMVHAKDTDSCRKIAKKLAEEHSVISYSILFSLKELKKTSMQYI